MAVSALSRLRTASVIGEAVEREVSFVCCYFRRFGAILDHFDADQNCAVDSSVGLAIFCKQYL
jgi:hypothetical protein